MNLKIKLISVSILIASSVALYGCGQQFSQFGSSVLSSTGLMSSSQANALFSVGSKLSKAVESVTDEQEHYLGRAVAATILSKYKPVTNPALVSYVNKVGLILAANSSRPETFGGYRFGILDTNEINAVSAPGGYIFLSKGFLSMLNSEEELAVVLAHEIGHVALKHGLSAISQSNLTDALQIIGKEAASASLSNTQGFAELNSLFGDSINEVTGTLLDKGYSRSQEYSADEYALELVKISGYNPSAVESVLEKLEKKTDASGGWFNTHPSAKKRRSELPEIESNDSGESIRTARFKKFVK